MSAVGKRRNVEKRREKSRCAARHRREKEAGIFTDLYVTVPIVSEPTVAHVDRIAVLRLAATLCRVRRVAEKVFVTSDVLKAGAAAAVVANSAPQRNGCGFYAEASVSECLDGFLLLVDSFGLIIYISPNCSKSLGLTQTDLIGHNIHDFMHADDAEVFPQAADDAASHHARFLMRMKSVLSPRGRNLNLKSAIYKTIHFTVSKSVVEFPPMQPRRYASQDSSCSDVLGVGGEPSSVGSVANGSVGGGSDVDDDEEGSAFSDSVTQLDTNYYLLHGIPLAHRGVCTSGDSHVPGVFMTRHTMDMKFTYCHERLSDYLGYDIKSLMGGSFYALVHPQDLTELLPSIKELYTRGQTCTGYFRLIAKTGGCLWVMSEINTVMHSTRGHRGQYVVCMHKIISGLDYRDIIADVQQTSPSILSKMESEKKIKQSKLVGPTFEQLLERAPVVDQFVPFYNPAIMLPDNGGGQLMGDSRRQACSSTNQANARKLRTRGYARAGRHHGRTDRRSGPQLQPNVEQHAGYKQLVFEPAANSQLVSPDGVYQSCSRGNTVNGNVHANVFVAGVPFAKPDISKSVGASDGDEKLTHLAPFVCSDKQQSLAVEQSSSGIDRPTSSAGDDDLATDYDELALDAFALRQKLERFEDAAVLTSHYQRLIPACDQTPEPLDVQEAERIESIYRYLRDERCCMDSCAEQSSPFKPEAQKDCFRPVGAGLSGQEAYSWLPPPPADQFCSLGQLAGS